MSVGNYQFAKMNNKYFLKLSGDLKYTYCSGFEGFLEKIFHEDDYSDIMVDMQEVEYLDSTNLGLFAHLCQHVLLKFGHKMTVICTNPNVYELFINLGFDEICLLIDQPENFEGSLTKIEEVDQNSMDKAKMIMETHRTLMNMNEKNNTEFKNVVALFEKQIG